MSTKRVKWISLSDKKQVPESVEYQMNLLTDKDGKSRHDARWIRILIHRRKSDAVALVDLESRRFAVLETAQAVYDYEFDKRYRDLRKAGSISKVEKLIVDFCFGKGWGLGVDLRPD